MSLNPDERVVLSHLLSRGINAAGHVVIEIFDTLLRGKVNSLPSVATDVVLARHGDQGFEVYLTMRPADDPEFPQLWHVPGGVTTGSTRLDAHVAKLLQRELQCEIEPARIKRVAIIHSPRHDGAGEQPPKLRNEHVYIHVVVVQESDKLGGDGRWFPEAYLPRNTVLHQRDGVIPIALAALRQQSKEALQENLRSDIFDLHFYQP